MSSKAMGNMPADEKSVHIYPGVNFQLARLAVDHYIKHQWPELVKEYDENYAHITGENSVVYRYKGEACIVYPTRTMWVVKLQENRVIGIVELE